jgi:hypothetical protein
LLDEPNRASLMMVEEHMVAPSPGGLLAARRARREAGNRASIEQSRVDRESPSDYPARLLAWARNQASSAVWEAAAKNPGTAANAHRSAAQAVGAAGQAEELAVRAGPGRPNWDAISAEELAAQAALLRDVFGNPFRPVLLDPAWLTQEVSSLAHAAYDNRLLPQGNLDSARLAVLADALLDAGCADAELLAHLRSPGPHVRGCWPVDLLTGRS